MATARSRVKKRVWRKVVVALIVGVVAIVALVFWQRYRITAWYLQGNKGAQETAILLMLDTARPIIERDVKMSLPQKIFSTMAGKRNEKERQTGALQDVRKFAALGFENHRLKFKDVHNLGSLRGFDVHGFGFALEWNRGDANEVLSAFNINFLKREVGEMRVNQDCGFFAELKVFIEKGARVN